jgi:hypothetical protein
MRLAIALLALAAPLAAQHADSLSLRVRVTDSASHPIPAVELSVVVGLNDVQATGTTGSDGVRILRFAHPHAPIEIIARKIGFTRTSAFVTPRVDSASVTLVLHRPVQALPAVTVNAIEDIKRRAYHVDADEIANSSRPIFDGMDVLLKLKPDIVYGRMKGCGVEEVWVNGKRIYNVPYSSMVEARQPKPPDPSMRTQGRPLPASPLSRASLTEVWTIMSMIKPEHIAEMNYADCFDNTVDKLHAQDALFVVLKDGIGFDTRRGSYVVDDSARKPTARAITNVAAVSPAVYRNRLLGIFDERTGDPVPDAIVTDVISGTTARSTPTGTVTLLFLPEGTTTIRVTKPGYAEAKLDVKISPADTIPITLVLEKVH